MIRWFVHTEVNSQSVFCVSIGATLISYGCWVSQQKPFDMRHGKAPETLSFDSLPSTFHLIFHIHSDSPFRKVVTFMHFSVVFSANAFPSVCGEN